MLNWPREVTMSNPNNRVRVFFSCGASHDPHELCIELRRGVPPELRCPQEQGPGYSGGGGGGGGCVVPKDLAERVEFTLRQDLEHWKRLGYVEVSA